MPLGGSNVFVNFETAPVHPVALSPDGARLAVCNLADGKLEIFDVSSGLPVALGSVPVGIDPVSVRFRNPHQAWVVNEISHSISVVDLPTERVLATIDTLDTPADLVFAGSPPKAFVSCALPNTIEVFDPDTYQVVTNITVRAERPKALAVSPDGRKVYAAVFESGNGTTIVGGEFKDLLFVNNAVSLTNGPYGGQNPPPNLGANFDPPLNPALPTNVPPPASGVIVRKSPDGRWLDGNQHDWTDFVSGTNASLTHRIPGWDLPDRDLAIVDTADFSVTYASGLMNICMALDVNPISGRVAVVGTEAINEMRFEPNLNGIFVRVKVALVDPADLGKTVKDLNPHLDYTAHTLPASERDKSIGDPRGIVWTADGARGYVAGMGSRNLVVIDTNGDRVPPQSIEVGEGPCGLALDEARHRLYVFNRFSSSLSVVDTASDTVIDAVLLFDPTPLGMAAGRRHLYDTRRTSGLGQASCASCHVDARMDRLGWDLGNPAGEMSSPLVNHQGTLVTNAYHPMKGVMMTQTLQDIIGHEPFHWRGDRPDIESFNATFTNLQGAATSLTKSEMGELREFLAGICFPPNRYRHFDNSLSTNMPLPGHFASGEDVLPAGAPLPVGNAEAGLAAFSQPENFCASCHTPLTGLGIDSALQGGGMKPIALGTNGEHHFPLAFRLEGPLRSKIAQFRNLADKIGMDGSQVESRAGFGFGHDGSIDSLTRFLKGVRIVHDQDVADLIAFLVSASGSDAGQAGAPGDPSPPAAMGRQLTVGSSSRPPILDAMVALANSPASRVDLIAKGMKDGLARGWFYERDRAVFQSDRRQESLSLDALLALAGAGAELTFTVVVGGSGMRLGIDRDSDGLLDRDELDNGTNPADPRMQPRVLVPSTQIALGSDLLLEAELPPLPAPLLGIVWQKNGQPLAGETNLALTLTNTSFEAAGNYLVTISTAFQNYTSAPVHIEVVPLLVAVAPTSQTVRLGSNATWMATATGLGPFHYQWRFNGRDLFNAQTASLVISNAQLTSEGSYSVTAANAWGAVTSDSIILTVLINPAVVAPPLDQRVVAGGNATFSVLISGHPSPFGYLLRKGSNILTNYVSGETSGFLTLFNVQSNNAGTYRLIITNAANPSPGLSLDPVTLTVLADSDHDGLPDEWELAHGLDKNNPADAQFDSDGDGQTNLQEYLAGTDPQDPMSFLTMRGLSLARESGGAIIQFEARSNKTYTVQSRYSTTAQAWSKVADFVAYPTNRNLSITNGIKAARERYYRLATPRIP